MNINQNIMIFSVFQQEVELSVNLDAHNNLLNYLRSNNYPVSEVQGCYKGIPEKSIMIIGFEHRSLVEKLTKRAHQETYLESHNDRTTFLVYPDGNKVKVGTLTNVSRDEALQNDNYSYNENGFFVTKK